MASRFRKSQILPTIFPGKEFLPAFSPRGRGCYTREPRIVERWSLNDRQVRICPRSPPFVTSTRCAPRRSVSTRSLTPSRLTRLLATAVPRINTCRPRSTLRARPATSESASPCSGRQDHGLGTSAAGACGYASNSMSGSPGCRPNRRTTEAASGRPEAAVGRRSSSDGSGNTSPVLWRGRPGVRSRPAPRPSCRADRKGQRSPRLLARCRPAHGIAGRRR